MDDFAALWAPAFQGAITTMHAAIVPALPYILAIMALLAGVNWVTSAIINAIRPKRKDADQ